MRWTIGHNFLNEVDVLECTLMIRPKKLTKCQIKKGENSISNNGGEDEQHGDNPPLCYS